MRRQRSAPCLPACSFAARPDNNGLVETSETAGRNRAQIFQGHVGGADLRERRNTIDEHDHGLADEVLRWRSYRDGGGWCGGDGWSDNGCSIFSASRSTTCDCWKP